MRAEKEEPIIISTDSEVYRGRYYGKFFILQTDTCVF